MNNIDIMIKSNKMVCDQISKSLGLSTVDEMLGHPNEDAEYESSRDLQDEEADQEVEGDRLIGWNKDER